MRLLSITPAVLITAVLALLLIAYVFVGGGRENTDRAPHCASSQALDQVKAELFRRAGQVRGASDTEFAKVANYSVVRAPSRMVRRHYRGSDKVTCTGSIVLDLPPGVAVAGGRRSLSSKVGYDLEPASGRTRLLTLSKADAIVIPLATLFQSSSVADRTNAPIPTSAEESNEPEPTRLEPDPTTKPQVVRPVAPPVAAPPRRSPKETPSQPAQAEPTTPPRSGSKGTVAPRTPAPPLIATARPSFNCRYARTRGEVAVCANAGLASLDRQMATQFFSALSVARPGQRAILQRSRNRFLRYRDSCPSAACIADAYRARMREISEIMAGAW